MNLTVRKFQRLARSRSLLEGVEPHTINFATASPVFGTENAAERDDLHFKPRQSSENEGPANQILLITRTRINFVSRLIFLFSSCFASKMSFSTLVSDLAFKDGARSTETASQASKAITYVSTGATSVSISGDISSQLHGGYSHPLARSWQAERQLTKVCHLMLY